MSAFAEREVGAERLLDHEPPPHAVVFAQHPATPELPADRRERIGRSCEVVQAVSAGFPLRLQPVQLFVQVFKRTRNVRIGGNAGDAFQQPAGDSVVDRAGGEFVQAAQQAGAELVVRHGLAGDPHHAEVVGQKVLAGEVIERGNDQPVRQVPGHAEDDERARLGLLLLRRIIGHPALHAARTLYGFGLRPPLSQYVLKGVP